MTKTINVSYQIKKKLSKQEVKEQGIIDKPCLGLKYYLSINNLIIDSDGIIRGELINNKKHYYIKYDLGDF
jgi:hypothetical protein